MLGRLGLVAASILAALLLLELAVRAWPNPGNLLHWSNLVEDARNAHRANELIRFVPDPELGFVPKEGLRRNGGPDLSGAKPPVLAVGDSFTYGDEVRSTETWPAHLERLLARPVLNGGVSGYGFDQSVLRAEHLATRHKPAAIVVSFIADDIRRTEMSRLWGANKPWFAVGEAAGRNLELRGVPVPPPGEARATLALWQRALGYSHLADFTMRRLHAVELWYGDHVRVHPRGAGPAIACKLTERLAALQKSAGVPVLLLAQYDPEIWKSGTPSSTDQRRLTADLLKCAEANGLPHLDTFDPISRQQPVERLYVKWHMSDAGNRVVADVLAAELRRRGID